MKVLYKKSLTWKEMQDRMNELDSEAVYTSSIIGDQAGHDLTIAQIVEIFGDDAHDIWIHNDCFLTYIFTDIDEPYKEELCGILRNSYKSTLILTVKEEP